MSVVRAGALVVLVLGCLAALLAAAQGTHPFGVPEATGAPGWLAGWFGQVAMWQAHFYRQLTGAVRAWQAEGGAAWMLIGLSFAYGVFHALGPGHGKAVIASYVLANRQTARNGAWLALLSALAQALVAVALVTVLAVALGATAAAMNRATQWLETAAYAVVSLLGAWLVWQKALRPWWGSKGGHGHDHHAHHHAPGCACGHAHAPSARQAAGPLSARKAWAAILAVGLRPCSGALIVLVFALAQGFFLAGVVATLAMGLGTGLTVAMLVALAAGARDAATRLGARLSTRRAAMLRQAIEALAAVAVLLLGLSLLGGQLAALR